MERGRSVQGRLLVGAVAVLLASPPLSWAVRKKGTGALTTNKQQVKSPDLGKYNRELIDKMINWSQLKNERHSGWGDTSKTISCGVRTLGKGVMGVNIPHSVLLDRALSDRLFPNVPLLPVLTGDLDLMISISKPPNAFSASEKQVAAAFRQMKAIADGYWGASSHKGVSPLSFELFFQQVEALLKALES